MAKYYINEKWNYSFIVVILFNVFICLLSYFGGFKEYIQLSVTVFSLMEIFGLGLYSKKTVQNNEEKENIQDIYIERNSWFPEISETKDIVILTGASGIGKTCLLNQLLHEFDDKKIKYFYENENYFWNLSKGNILDYDYVILDQFERALAFDNITENIQALKQLKGKKLVITVRKEYLGDVYRLFDFDLQIQTVWLDYRENEINEIEEYLQKLTLDTDKTLKQSRFYSDILEDVKSGSLSMIQLSFLVREIQYRRQEYVQSQIKKYTYIDETGDKNEPPKRICDYDAVIRDDWEKQLDNYGNSETAYMILYLLSLDYNGRYTNAVKDFENICVQNENVIVNAIKFLVEHRWIKKVKESYDVNSRIEPYEISHDYMIDMFEKICRNKLSADIRNNIDYYHVNCQLQRNTEDKEESWKSYTNIVCRNFLESKSRKYTNYWLIFTAIFMLFINAVTLNRIFLPKDDQCLMLLALDIIVGLSIYYVYNYYYYFITVYDQRYLFGIILAAPAIMVPFVCKNYWALPLGVEVCVIGLVVWLVSRDVRDAEKKFFSDKAVIFCVIGLVIVALSFFFKVYTNGNIILATPFLLVYIIYILISIKIHINRTHIMEITGKVLYGGRRMKFKESKSNATGG